MFEKSLEALNSKVSSLQEQLLLQTKALETAKADRKTMVKKVDLLIRSVYDSYGVDGLNDVVGAIAMFISQQEVPIVTETPAPVVTEPVAEAPVPQPKATEKRAFTTTKSKREAPVVPVTPPTPTSASKPVAEIINEDNLCCQPSIFGALDSEQETEPCVDKIALSPEITATQVKETAPAPEKPALLNLENPTWINFDQKAWLEEREGTPADEMPCFFEERMTILLREGWSYNEIPFTRGALSDGTVISPENPDPCERLAPVIVLYTEDRTAVRKVFEYEWFSKVERGIIDKMFAVIYAEPASEFPGWRKALHIVERLTGLVSASDEAVERAKILNPIGVIKMLSCGIVGTTVTDKKGNKTTITMTGWKKYLIDNMNLSPEEVAYLKENFAGN